MNRDKLESAIKSSRDKDTCHYRSVDQRTTENPSIGQCAVTALVIQDFIWWELLYCLHHNHVRNKLPDGEIIDLTKDQFSEETVICLDQVLDRDEVLNNPRAKRAKTKERYQLLKSRVEKKI